MARARGLCGELPEIRIDILSAFPMDQVAGLWNKVGLGQAGGGFGAHPRGHHRAVFADDLADTAFDLQEAGRFHSSS